MTSRINDQRDFNKSQENIPDDIRKLKGILYPLMTDEQVDEIKYQYFKEKFKLNSNQGKN